MSEAVAMNPFAKLSDGFFRTCPHCERPRQLAAKAQDLMDEVHRGKRITVIPPVKCGQCDEGYQLTPQGSIFAILIRNYLAELERLAKEEAIPL